MNFKQKAPSSNVRPRNIWLRYLQFSIIIAIFIFLGFNFVKDISTAKTVQWNIDYRLFGLSFVVLIVGLLAQAQVWRMNLRAIGVSRCFKDVFKIVYLANMGRYLPGKVWSVLGLVYLAREVEVPQASAVLCTFVSQITSILAGLVMSGVFLIGFSALSHKMSLWWIVGALLLILVFLHPYVHNIILKLVAKITKEKNIEVAFPLGAIAKSTLMYLGVWFLFGLSFSLLVLCLGSQPLKWLVYCLGILPAAYLIGYLVVFSPGGWGVREGAMVLLLSQFMSNYLAIATSIFSRILFTISEVVFFIVALRIEWSKDKVEGATNLSAPMNREGSRKKLE